MNDLRLENIEIGGVYSFAKVISNEDMMLFERLSGDINPMHTDKEFATGHGFKDRIVYGMLVSSLFSTLVGMYIPGKNCLFQEIRSLKFKSPVYIGDQLTVTGKVSEKDDEFKRIVIKADVRNQNNIKVIRAELVAGVLE